jgi:hypothetical protein
MSAATSPLANTDAAKAYEAGIHVVQPSNGMENNGMGSGNGNNGMENANGNHGMGGDETGSGNGQGTDEDNGHSPVGMPDENHMGESGKNENDKTSGEGDGDGP